jgi:alpha-glucosidase
MLRSMDARDLVRRAGEAGASWRMGHLRAAWRRHRTDAVGLRPAGTERARVPGHVMGAEPRPGGGLIRFERSTLLVRVALGGAVFCGWDGAEPLPSYALAGPCPPPDTRAGLEPDKDGGWRVVSERLLVIVQRHGTVEVRTPGGLLLRRETPPRWWEATGGTYGPDGAGGESGAGSPGPLDSPGAPGITVASRWMQRWEVAADARFFGLGGRADGSRLRDGSYRLWNTGGRSLGAGEDPRHVTMPVLLVVADVGTHLVFHDNSWDGRVTLSEGVEGQGSGHDQHGRGELRMAGGPLRYWVIAGTPSRVLNGWARLTGAPALPPGWALGHQHARFGRGGEEEIRRVAAGYRERGLPLRAVHLDTGHCEGHRVFTVNSARFPDLPALAAELRSEGIRLVSALGPGVKVQRGYEVYDSGCVAGAFVRDARGREVRGAGRPGVSAFPDFTDPRVRKWWGELHAERLGRGFDGVWHGMDEPTSFAAFGERTLPRSARHELEGRGGDHREAHNVYALTMAEAAHAGLRELRPGQRPFVLSRSGWAGMQRYGGSWSGEVEAGWAGLRSAVSLVLSMGLSGVPYSGADVGGLAGTPSPELYLRWFQLAAYLPLFRTHAARRAGRREPWEFGAQVLEHCAAAMRERERLLPYFATLAQLAHRTGAPYVRPVWWQHPRDRALRECDDAFLLGDALLVAPVLEAGARRRTVRLPRGRWHEVATGTAHEGPGTVTLDAPLERIPVLARAGAAVPVAGADGATELEVWAPAPGRAGSGLVIADAGDGWERAEPERFTVRSSRGVPAVLRENGGPVGYRVRWRS